MTHLRREPGQELVEQEEPPLELASQRETVRGARAREPRLAHAVDGGEIELHRLVGTRGAWPTDRHRQIALVVAERRLDMCARRGSEHVVRGRRLVGRRDERHAQLVEDESRAPAVEAGLVSRLDRDAPARLRGRDRGSGTEEGVAHRAHARHGQDRALHVRQSQLAAQLGRVELRVVDEAVRECRPVEHLLHRVRRAVRVCAREHLGEGVLRHGRGEVLLHGEQHAGVRLRDVGVGRELELRAEHEVLHRYLVHAHEVLAQVALGLQRAAGGRHHLGAAFGGPHVVPELEARRVQPAHDERLPPTLARRFAVGRQEARAPLLGVRPHGGVGGDDPRVLHARQVDQELAIVAHRERARREEAPRGREERPQPRRVIARAGDEVGDRMLGAVGEVGERVAEQFERGDAGVVDVVVRPRAPGRRAQLREGGGEQCRGIVRRRRRAARRHAQRAGGLCVGREHVGGAHEGARGGE